MGRQYIARGSLPVEALARIRHPDHRGALGLAVGQRVDQEDFPTVKTAVDSAIPIGVGLLVLTELLGGLDIRGGAGPLTW